MKKIFILACIFFVGCASHDPYPLDWPYIDLKEKCTKVDGIYENIGLISKTDNSIALSSLFFPDSNNIHTDEEKHIIFKTNKDGTINIKIKGERNNIIATQKIRPNDYRCVNGWNVIQSSSGHSKDIFIYFERKNISFTKTDGDLLIREKASVKGVAFIVFPVMNNSTKWYWFKKINKAKVND